MRLGEFETRALDESLLLEFHSLLASELFPDEAGRFRTSQNQIREHVPPAPAQVPVRIRDYVRNLAERIAHLSGDADDLLLELLAYAEGELLSIHPFPDLNGRISRLWLLELLRRLQLPTVDLVPIGEPFRNRYFEALAAADRRNLRPLMELWKERLVQPLHVNEIPLPGCTPTPLASYLKALAVLRLVAEAGPDDGGDPDATGFWRNDVFVLRTRLTADELRRFFLERYRPTPLVAPWNGGSGFYPKDNRLGIQSLVASQSARFDHYRQAISAAQQAVIRFGLKESPKLEEKAKFLQALRNIAPEPLLRWMDAAVILSGDDPRYPPLLGTGGNDGRLDFTNNFMQRLSELLDVASGSPRPGSEGSLDSAIFGLAATAQSDRAIGQFSPGAAGGPNASSAFEGDASINAWDFVLMLEGAVLFGASTARRLESSDPAILAAPFTVRSRAGTVGSASANDDGDARGEIWMPLWSSAFSIDELRCLLTEGRAALNGKSTRDGLDFARAVAQLGVDRGIEAFQRYGFLMRSGKAFLATPLSRVPVRRNPDADLINELERRNWLASVQRYARDDNAPNAFRSAARQLDTALFALTQQASRLTLQTVLRQLGRIESALSISPKSQESVRAPMPRLSPVWAIKAGGERASDSPEFRIAAALAGLHLVNEKRHSVLHARRHLARVGELLNAEGDRGWEPTSALAVWGVGPLAGNLAALLHRRRLEAAKQGAEGETLASTCGASCDDLAAFLANDTDDTRIAELFGGLACVDLRELEDPQGSRDPMLPPAFALLKIFFTSEGLLHALKLDWLPEDRKLRLPAEIPARLAGGDVHAAIRLAWQRLRTFGVKLPGRDPPRATGADGPRWLAALCIPLSFAETGRLIRSLNLEAEEQPSTESQA
ncbi:MAG: type I-G CRISPR-associated protein Cas8g1/Csx17 [Panacagrimonas sp.]